MNIIHKLLSRKPAASTGVAAPRAWNKSWGKDNNTQFLLRGLRYPVLRFCMQERDFDFAAAHLNEPEQEISRYISNHRGATIRHILEHVAPRLRLADDEVQALLVRLVDKGILRPCGLVPLEVVDRRYERVSACAVCGASSKGHTTILWKYGTPIVRCSTCGLPYANPRWKAEELFGRYTEEYWAHYADTILTTSVDAEANYARWLSYLTVLESSKQMGRLLDVGCATGEFMLAAQALGWEACGVEASPLAAARAQQATGSKVHTGTLDTADFPGGYFDVVTMWDVIEHLQYPRVYIEKAAELLRPGGILSITTPNIRSLAYRLLGPEWTPVGPNDHLYYFAPRTLARLLREHGFSIYVMHTSATELATWQQWLRFPLLRRLAPTLRKISLPVTNRLLLGDELYVVAQLAPTSSVTENKSFLHSNEVYHP